MCTLSMDIADERASQAAPCIVGALGLRGLGLRGRRHDDIPCGQYISNKRFSRKARGCKSTSVGADLSCPAPIYRPSLAVPLSALLCEKCIIWSLRLAPHFLILNVLPLAGALER